MNSKTFHRTAGIFRGAIILPALRVVADCCKIKSPNCRRVKSPSLAKFVKVFCPEAESTRPRELIEISVWYYGHPKYATEKAHYQKVVGAVFDVEIQLKHRGAAAWR